MIDDLWMLWWASGGSLLASIILQGWVDVCPWNSLSGHSPLLHYVREALCPNSFPIDVGSDRSWLHLQLRQANNEWGDHPHGNSCHWWSWWGLLRVYKCLLLVSPEEGRAIKCTLHLSPVGLSWSGHGGGEDLYQHILCPMGVSQLPLPGCNHPFSGHFNHSVSP